MASVDGPAHRDLDRSLARGIAWTAGAKTLNQVLSWAATLLVVKLLTPGDYGLVGMSAVLVALVGLVSEFGVGIAVVTMPDLREEQREQLHGLALVIGVLAFVVGALCAVPLAHFFRAPDLPSVVLVQSVGFVLAAVQSVPGGVLQKRLEFKRLATIEVTRSLVASVAALGLAFGGFGYWTLVLSEVLAATVAALLFLRAAPQRMAWPRLATIAPVVRFSGQQLVGKLSWFVYSNADFAVAGRVAGQVAAGHYSFAWTLASLPVEKVSALIGRVSPAIFAAVREDRAALQRYVLVMTEALALVTMPAFAGLALVCGDFVPLVFGDKWTGAVLPLQLLAGTMVLRAQSPIVSNAILILGGVRFLMWNGIGCALLFPIAFLIGAREAGVAGIALAWLAVYPLSCIPVYRRTFRDVVPARDYLRVLRPAIEGVLVLVVAILAIRAVLPGTSRLDVTLRVVATIVGGTLAYGAVLLTRHRARVTQLVAALKQQRG